MSPSAKRLLQEALALPEHDRIEVLDALTESLTPTAEPVADVEAAWADEITRRLRDLETGAVTPVSWDEARKVIFGSRE